MDPNSNKPLTSSLSANATAPQAVGAAREPGERDENLAAQMVTEISPEGVKIGQSSSAQFNPNPEISPGGVKVAQSSSTEPSADSQTGGAGSAEFFRRADDLLVLAIATGATQREAAQRAGVSESTVKRRCQDANFRNRILDTRAEIRCEAVGQLTANSKKAIDTLFKALEASSESVRVAAARAVLRIQLDMGGRGEENARIAEQIAALQAALNAIMSGR